MTGFTQAFISFYHRADSSSKAQQSGYSGNYNYSLTTPPLISSHEINP